MKNPKLTLFSSFAVICLLFFTSCSDDDDLVASVTLTTSSGKTQNIDGDFTGNGGTATETYSFENPNTIAEYNADITCTTVGEFKMVITDAQGTVILDRTLTGTSPDDSFSGTSST